MSLHHDDGWALKASQLHQAQAGKLLPYLAAFTFEHQTEGTALQKQVIDAEAALARAIEDAWAVVEEDDVEGRVVDVSGSLAMKVPKPSVTSSVALAADWKVLLLDDEAA